ncbi:hypothetical protein ACP4OV_030356 [Aristida adscensionis]
MDITDGMRASTVKSLFVGTVLSPPSFQSLLLKAHLHRRTLAIPRKNIHLPITGQQPKVKAAKVRKRKQASNLESVASAGSPPVKARSSPRLAKRYAADPLLDVAEAGEDVPHPRPPRPNHQKQKVARTMGRRKKVAFACATSSMPAASDDVDPLMSFDKANATIGQDLEDDDYEKVDEGNSRTKINVRCNPGDVVAAVSMMIDEQRKIIAELGFSDLLGIRTIKELPWKDAVECRSGLFQVYYLDNLRHKCAKMDWTSTPRIRLYSKRRVSKLARADILDKSSGNETYGKLPISRTGRTPAMLSQVPNHISNDAPSGKAVPSVRQLLLNAIHELPDHLKMTWVRIFAQHDAEVIALQRNCGTSHRKVSQLQLKLAREALPVLQKMGTKKEKAATVHAIDDSSSSSGIDSDDDLDDFQVRFR